MAERLSQIIVVLFGVCTNKHSIWSDVFFYLNLLSLEKVVGWIVGYINQQFSHTVMVLGAGVLLAALLTLPPWPMFRRKPLNWRKAKKEAPSEKESGSRSTKENKEAGSPTAQKQKKKAK